MPSKSDLEELIRNKASHEEIVDLLDLFKPIELALLVATTKADPNTARILNSNCVEPLWANRFNALSLERNLAFQFIDTKKPHYRANFYCGYVLYLAALKGKTEAINAEAELNELVKKNRQSLQDKFLKVDDIRMMELKSIISARYELYHAYLSIAIKQFNSFHASSAFFTNLIQECHAHTKKNDLDQLRMRLIDGAPALTQETTPTSLLFANTFFYLAGFYQKIKHYEESAVCYRKCWEYLCLAELLESRSTAEIHNAYFGEGLKLSNPYGINSIKTLKEQCILIADNVLTTNTRNTIEAHVYSILSPSCKADSTEQDQQPNIRAMS